MIICANFLKFSRVRLWRCVRQINGSGPATARSMTTTEHDYIVVGSGSAGSVLANRLSAHDAGSNEVLVLEAGPMDSTWKISMPAALMYCLKDPKYSWCYETAPQSHAKGRSLFWPRGKVVGGSSSLNAMVYVRGHAWDYDRWETQGAKGWSYFDCLPYFKKAQCHQLGPNEYRGGDGPLYVTRGKWENPLFKVFVEAGVQAGYEHTEDINGFKQEGVGHFDMTIKNGKRCSAAVAYLHPALKERQNLRLETQAMVGKILLRGTKAIGVEYEKSGEKRQALARKEVILSGGALNSPQLLLLSGIGDGNHLKEFGIPVVVNLPGVGKNLQDHLEVYVQYKCRKPVTLYKYQWKYPLTMIKTGLQWFATGTGAASTTHMEAGAFMRSSHCVAHPDIQLHFLPSIVLDHGQEMGKCHAFQAHAGTMRATSVGDVKLKSNNPKDKPIINPNYLATEQDIVDFRACVRLTQEIFLQKAFDEYRGDSMQSDLKSDKDIDDFVRATGETAYHPSCTSKMGSETDPTAVVDPKCRVLGVENLRVVDASIMPSIVSGNLNAPCIMMAEKAADIILGKIPMPKLKVPVWKPLDPNKQR